MARSAITKEARARIIDRFINDPKMSKEGFKDEIRPHYIPDYEKLKEQDIGRIANRMAASVRDENGRREIFAIEEDGEQKLIYVEKSKDLGDIRKVYESLVKTKKGLNPSIKKVFKHGMEVAGQLSLDFKATNKIKKG